MYPKPRLLVSSCLLGEAVRFDGGHRRSTFVTTLGAHAELVPVCPEIASGMGAPRPSLRLVAADGRLRMLSSAGADETGRVRDAATRVLDAAGELDGAVLKKGSPTCGPDRVKVYGENGMPLHPGIGLFAAAVSDRHPHLAIEDEGRLQDELLRDSFLARAFAHARLRHLFSRQWRTSDVVAFHAAHKLLVMAHSPRAYRNLGRLVARCRDLAPDTFQQTYTRELMAALATQAGRGRHTTVLQHMAGYVSADLDAASRRELHEAINDYLAGLEPLGTPRALLRHHVRRLEVEYLKQQHYLQPYPRELALA